MKRTLWGVLHDELWSMDVYDSRDQAEAARRSYEGSVLPLVRVTEEVVDVGDWTDLLRATADTTGDCDDLAEHLELYALAANAAADRSPFGHPMPESELRAVCAAVDAVVAALESRSSR